MFDHLIFHSPHFGTAMFQCITLQRLLVVLTPVGWTPRTLCLSGGGSTNCKIIQTYFSENSQTWFEVCSHQKSIPCARQRTRAQGPGVEVIRVSGWVAKLTFDRLGNTNFELSLSMA